MKQFIALIIVALLAQTSFLPINICLLLLICRSLDNPDKSDLILAFAAGLGLGFLSAVNIGFYAAAFVAIVTLTHLIRKLPVIALIWLVAPISFAALGGLSLIEGLLLHRSTSLNLLTIESLVSVPMFLCWRFYADRFLSIPGKIILRHQK